MSYSKRLKSKLNHIHTSSKSCSNLEPRSDSEQSESELNVSAEYVIGCLANKMRNLNVAQTKFSLQKEIRSDDSTRRGSQLGLSPSNSVNNFSFLEMSNHNILCDSNDNENYTKKFIDEGRERDRKVPNRSPKRSPSKLDQRYSTSGRFDGSRTVMKNSYNVLDLDYTNLDIARKKTLVVGSPSIFAGTINRTNSNLTGNSGKYLRSF